MCLLPIMYVDIETITKINTKTDLANNATYCG